jgi:hypothetical protein
MNVPDNYDAWSAHDGQMENLLERLPVCEDAKCGKRIQDDYYFKVDGEILCEDCMIRRYRKNTEYFVNQ